MFGCVLLWTPIQVLLRILRRPYALWRQKTPLTNGLMQEAKSHCRTIGEAWLKLGWKSIPWVHWTVAHCGAVLQKYRNLYVFNNIPAEHRHKLFNLRDATDFADKWSTLLADLKHVAPADRRFQRTIEAAQFDISTSMWFLTDPKYHVRLVNGPRNLFPNTMFGGVLLWTPIQVLLRILRRPYALWRQKTPLTNGLMQEAKSHCRTIGEAWLKLGWKSTPWVHWTVAHCGAVLQKYRNLYVFNNIPAEHRHKLFNLAVKNSMCGRCLRRPRVSRRGLTHVLNLETLDVGLRHRAARQRLALGKATRDRRKRHCMYA